jgi:hypothetical protein
MNAPPSLTHTCACCSTPIQPGSLTLSEHGELFHIACRRRGPQDDALESKARVVTAPTPAARIVPEHTRREPIRQRTPCPVCGEPAFVLDWRPSVPWLAIEGCACDAFFVWTALLDSRLPTLSREDLGTLSVRIRSVRKTGTEAWLTTRDGALGGTLIIRDAQPDRPT